MYGVSLGPGDPDLVTVKAMKVLAMADRVYYPGAIAGSGAVNSFALEILQKLGVPETKLKSMLFAMTMPRDEVEKVYDCAFASVMRDLEKGLCVAVVCVGDTGIYSTFAHLLERIAAASVEVEMIAGVPAFIAAGASARVPLALRSDRVVVLPCLGDVNELDRYLDRYETVVVMKLSMIRKGLCSYLQKRDKGFVYAEYLGTPREFVTRNLQDLKSRRIPYFALIIFFNRDQSPSRSCPER